MKIITPNNLGSAAGRNPQTSIAEGRLNSHRDHIRQVDANAIQNVPVESRAALRAMIEANNDYKALVNSSEFQDVLFAATDEQYRVLDQLHTHSPKKFSDVLSSMHSMYGSMDILEQQQQSLILQNTQLKGRITQIEARYQRIIAQRDATIRQQRKTIDAQTRAIGDIWRNAKCNCIAAFDAGILSQSSSEFNTVFNNASPNEWQGLVNKLYEKDSIVFLGRMLMRAENRQGLYYFLQKIESDPQKFYNQRQNILGVLDEIKEFVGRNNWADSRTLANRCYDLCNSACSSNYVSAQAVSHQVNFHNATLAQASGAQANVFNTNVAQASGAQANVVNAAGLQVSGAQANVGSAKGASANLANVNVAEACGAVAHLVGASFFGASAASACVEARAISACGAVLGVCGLVACAASPVGGNW